MKFNKPAVICFIFGCLLLIPVFIDLFSRFSLKSSKQDLSFLPEGHSDFINSYIVLNGFQIDASILKRIAALIGLSLLISAIIILLRGKRIKL